MTAYSECLISHKEAQKAQNRFCFFELLCFLWLIECRCVAALPEQFTRPALLVLIGVVVHQQVTRERTIDEMFIGTQCIIAAVEIIDDARRGIEPTSHRHRDAVRSKRIESNSAIADC